MARIRYKPPKSTKNRYDGRLDYTLPSPWTVAADSDYEYGDEIAAEVPSIDSLPKAKNGTPYLPLNIYNYGSPGEGRNDDDDGFAHDALIWDIQDADFGFEKELYIFREAPPLPKPEDSSEGPPSIKPVEVGLKSESPIKTATIIIEDYNSTPTKLGTQKADRLADSNGNGAIYAFDGNDTLRGAGGNDVLFGAKGNDKVCGSSGDDFLLGGTGSDTICGGAGNDQLDGGLGDDILRGGNGDDTYVVDSLKDKIIDRAGTGVETVLAAVRWELGTGLDNLTLLSSDNINGTGNDFNNRIIGGSGNNQLDGRTGDDDLIGGDGDDTLLGGQGDDSLYGDAGNTASPAGDGDDVLYGGEGNDNLQGEAGNDTLVGGVGNDFLSGGSGSDKFVFNTLNDGVDTLQDFNSATSRFGEIDQILISAAGFGASSIGQFSYDSSTGALSFNGTQFATLDINRVLNPNLDIVLF